jgi:hypothetical protein
MVTAKSMCKIEKQLNKVEELPESDSTNLIN